MMLAVLSKAVRMDLETGALHTVCPKGHEFVVEPVRWDPEEREGLYGSDQDFCGCCGESLDHAVPEWKLNKKIPANYLEVEGGTYWVSPGDGHWVLFYAANDPPYTRIYYGWYENATVAMEAVNKLEVKS